jgi:hypothetical protein
MPNEPRRVIYITKTSDGEAQIVAVDVIKETEKQYQIDEKSKRVVSGTSEILDTSWVKKVTHRYRIFDNLLDAQNFCREKLEREFERLSDRLEKARRALDALNRAITETEARDAEASAE